MYADELEQVLNYASQRIIEYVKEVENAPGKVCTFHDPAELAKMHLRSAKVDARGQGFEGLKISMDWILENSVATWHPAFLEKLYAGTNPVGVVSDMLLSVLNTNSHVFTASPALTIIERYIGHKYAELLGFKDAKSGGITFPGGSYSNMTSMHMARSIHFPQTKLEGNSSRKLAVFASDHCHYSVSKAAIMQGLGASSVFKVKVHEDGVMDTDDLVAKIEESLSKGYKPFYVNATAGTTVYGSFDPFHKIADITEKYGLWLHIDGSWGANVVFSPKQASKMSGSSRAQSITVNPHKMLGVPCTCSFLLVPDMRKFPEANSMNADYLFHRSGADDEMYDLADGTMGCGRRADALKLYLAWQYYGTQGYADRVDHAFEMTEYLAKKVAGHPQLALLSSNPPPCLQTCFWFVPKSRSKAQVMSAASRESNTRYTKEITSDMLKQSRFLVDYSPHPEFGHFFRVVLNSPTVTKALVDNLVSNIVESGNNKNKATGSM